MNETFDLTKDFELVVAGTKAKLEDSMCKGYVYANLFFYDEVQKEIEKLKKIIKRIHDEVVTELNVPEDNPV